MNLIFNKGIVKVDFVIRFWLLSTFTTENFRLRRIWRLLFILWSHQKEHFVSVLTKKIQKIWKKNPYPRKSNMNVKSSYHSKILKFSDFKNITIFKPQKKKLMPCPRICSARKIPYFSPWQTDQQNHHYKWGQININLFVWSYGKFSCLKLFSWNQINLRLKTWDLFQP